MLHNISLQQFAVLWTHLMQASYNDASYVSDVAEIYAYTLMPNMPADLPTSSPDMQKRNDQHRIHAGQALAEACRMFCELNENTAIIIDGKTIDAWDDGTPFLHRAHVKVLHTQNST